ncbi:NUDIX hydrolase [Zhihengliuella halotolerans]|uniref:8-oxo-dGTP diphosphatase n=1 Tax=Zhihengliuella halotolerans TaxID=370736 RepID=A0A4Q8A9Z7_9MICC|nr:NUDIX hydrolase [Zhihengliuella halotolerans]RZU60910.1 8-oxo-dGTP diphosphatase [Zhihengliuella halotolerans]
MTRRSRDFDTRLAAYCVIVDDDRILLALWDARATNPDHDPRWTLPGGGVELGESIEDGAVREVEEETGYQVELTGLLGVDSGHVPAGRRLHGEGRPLQTVAVLYSARVTGGRLRFEVGGSTSRAGWFPLAEVEGLNRVGRVDQALEMLRVHKPDWSA